MPSFEQIAADAFLDELEKLGMSRIGKIPIKPANLAKKITPETLDKIHKAAPMATVSLGSIGAFEVAKGQAKKHHRRYQIGAQVEKAQRGR